jgi:hypothetical protein
LTHHDTQPKPETLNTTMTKAYHEKQPSVGSRRVRQIVNLQ